MIAFREPGYLPASVTSQPRSLFILGEKDGIADRLCDHPVYFPANFPKMTSSGFFRAVPAPCWLLDGSVITVQVRSIAGKP
jgi:hypothetical protein